jgi:hypothetical protein
MKQPARKLGVGIILNFQLVEATEAAEAKRLLPRCLLDAGRHRPRASLRNME